MRSWMPSSAAILPTCGTNSAICCCRWCSMPGWPRSKAPSPSAMWSRPSRRSSSAAIRMSSATHEDLSPEEVKSLWDSIKAEEKAERRARRARAWRPDPSLMRRVFSAGIPTALPALTRAQKLTAKAAKVGFDWPEAAQVVDKIHEELDEVEEAAASGRRDRIEDEIGDLLFAVTNLARHYGIDPETALRRTNAKFERRFGAVESSAGEPRAGPSTKQISTRWKRSGSRPKTAEREPGRVVIGSSGRSGKRLRKPRLLAGHEAHPENRCAPPPSSRGPGSRCSRAARQAPARPRPRHRPR